MSHLEGHAELKESPFVPLLASSLSSVHVGAFPSLPHPGSLQPGKKGEERKEWILECQVPGHQGTLVTHSPPGSPRLKNLPRDIAGGMEAGRKWQEPLLLSSASHTHIRGLLNRALYGTWESNPGPGGGD